MTSTTEAAIVTTMAIITTGEILPFPAKQYHVLLTTGNSQLQEVLPKKLITSDQHR